MLPRIVLAFVVLFLAVVARADLAQEMKDASAAIKPVQGELEAMINNGQLAEANQNLVALFPAETRTAGQALVLGNMLYGMDAKLSYQLHKEACEKTPEDQLTQLEWAMQQHRAGEHAGALAAYDAFSKIRPNYAPVHGMAADCLIRLGRTAEAVARWEQSEKATSGTLIDLEELVCEVYKDPTLKQSRADLRAKAQKGDVDAAVEIIALDCRFPFDWWNTRPHRTYLKHDLPLLDKLPDNPRVRAARCVAELKGQTKDGEDLVAEDARAIFNRHGFVIDPAGTLPSDGVLAGLMLGAAYDFKLLTPEQAGEKFAARLREAAKTSKDAELWNIVAHFYTGTPEFLDIELQAWEATAVAKFATGYLMEKFATKSLKLDDPKLAAALRQFPEDSLINNAAASLAEAEGKLSEEILVRAIKSEYRHFSPNSALTPRPGAKPLRRYFQQLAAVLNEKK